MDTAQPTLKIFLSSTAIDMQEHRKKVTETILRLGYLPVEMEHFGSIPGKPVDVCKTKVKQCDALIVMASHRYGWIPSIEDGGDGQKSMTWLEVITARDPEIDIPVLTFMVDDSYGWPYGKEQDALGDAATEEKMLEIGKNVRALKDFKKYLGKLTYDKFTTPEDLALKVSTSLANWEPKQKDNPNHSSEPQKPQQAELVFRTVHHLQPAPHFRGRKQLLKELIEWWHQPVTPDRVRALVAIGGTGKTAIAERFISSISKEPLRGSVLVWSFYDEPNTDSFLREACAVFTGKEPEGEGGKLERLQRTLQADNRQHLIVLDGLERVQSEGREASGHAKGDIEDHRLKNLLRSVAAGLGNTRMLITTRFKLTDLVQWENAGYKGHELDVLDVESAIEVLKAWHVKGDAKRLAEIAKTVGYHALSVSVLGSYLNHYCNGNPDDIKDFKLSDISPDESQAAKLERILGGYAKNLSDAERDLLIRLSVFPKGITVDILLYLVNAGGEIAGALIGIQQRNLATIAERLKNQGLIYSYNNNNTIVYTAHPFLREYFRTLLGVKPEDIHEVIREKLAVGLDTKPESKPTEAAVLDKYEQLIEHSILAGHHDEAFDLFWNSMGGGGSSGNHLLHILCDYGRILRIISLFSEDGLPEKLTDQISPRKRGNLLATWGLGAMAIGDLKKSESCHTIALEIDQNAKNTINVSHDLINIGTTYLHMGLFSKTQKIFTDSINNVLNKEVNNDIKFITFSSNAHMAYGLYQTGEISLAKEYFLTAEKIKKEPLYSSSGFYETEYLFNTNQKIKAQKRINENLETSIENQWPRDITSCYFLMGMISLQNSIAQAKTYLLKVRDWTEKSGHMELIIRSHILATEIAYHSKDYTSALAEAQIGLNHAESCGFGRFAIDLLLLLAKTYIAIPNYQKALPFARQALDRSVHPDRQYAWGEANGLHLCGVCHNALGEYALARQRLEAALALREKIQHPETEETRKLLESLP